MPAQNVSVTQPVRTDAPEFGPGASIAPIDDVEYRVRLGYGADAARGSQIVRQRIVSSPVYLPGDPRI